MSNRKIKTVFSVDKLKLCYRTTNGTFGYLVQGFNLNADKSKSDISSTIDRGDYCLNLIDHSDNEYETTAITISTTFQMDGKRHKLGVFDIKKEAKYCFFSFENRILYSPFIYVNGNTYNCANFISYITDDLRLEFNNITYVEIAMDTTRNYVNKTRKYIRDFERYDLFVNGNLIKDETATIPNYVKAYSSSRKKMSRQPTLYFRHREQDGLQLKIYNKRKEMTESEPSKMKYIPQWLDFGVDAPIYRAEITVRNRDIREYMALVGIEGEEAMSIINSPKMLANLWQYEADRLLYFRDRATGDIVRLADL